MFVGLQLLWGVVTKVFSRVIMIMKREYNSYMHIVVFLSFYLSVHLGVTSYLSKEYLCFGTSWLTKINLWLVGRIERYFDLAALIESKTIQSLPEGALSTLPLSPVWEGLVPPRALEKQSSLLKEQTMLTRHMSNIWNHWIYTW